MREGKSRGVFETLRLFCVAGDCILGYTRPQEGESGVFLVAVFTKSEGCVFYLLNS